MKLHKATDRRCYDGQPCVDLKKEIEEEFKLLQRIKELEPEYSITYFPYEGMYMSFVNYKPLSLQFFSDRGDCLIEAFEILSKEK